MNTKNNSRRRQSREKIEKVFVELLQSSSLEDITVSDICQRAQLNRSTFYANYLDIYDLADKVRDTLDAQVAQLYKDEIALGFNSNDYLRLFRHMYDNQLFYKTYFKLGYEKAEILTYDTQQAEEHFNNRFIAYHAEFFRSGFNAIVKMWLDSGCRETPEEMNEILESEYRGRQQSAAT